MILPNSLEAEKGIIGSVLIDPRTLPAATQLGICPNSFFHPGHTIVWETLLKLESVGKPIDFVFLTQELSDSGKLELVGGTHAISLINTFTPTASKWRDYSEIVLEKQRRRRIIADSQALLDLATNESIEMVEVEGFAQNVGLDASKSMVSQEEVRHIKHGVIEFLASVEAAQMGTDTRLRLNLGLPNLERLTNGIPPGNFVTVGAQTSVGKTAFALQCAWSVAHKQNKPVLFISLEMTLEKLAGRISATTSGIPLNKLYAKKPDLSDADFDSLNRGLSKVGATEFIVWTPSITPTVEQVAAMMRTQKIKHPELALVVVDYLQLLEPSKFKDNREQQVSHMSRHLMRTAVSLGVTTIALSQLNDDDQLRESRAIGHDSRIVIQLTRPKGEDKGERILHLDKNSEGQSKISFPLHFNGPQQTFREIYDN